MTRCIQEVELDIDTKLANIERTEKARVAQEEERKSKRKAEPSVTLIPQNFNANFQEHKFDFQNRAVSSTYGGGRGGGGGRGRGGGGGRGAASDDNMVDRFKRSARGRGRGR